MAASRATLALMAFGALAARSPDPSMHANSAQQEHDAQSFLQADVVAGARSKTYPAGWFGGFSQGESTYDYDGTKAHRHQNTMIDAMDGWNPQQKNPFADAAVNQKWFQETKSGGDKVAYQTFYPAEKSSMSGNGVETGSWYEDLGGAYQQSYLNPTTLGEQGPSASWFDSSVKQLDGFGRQKMPAVGSPRNYLDWEERTVNTTLTCKAPGCTANVSLLAPFNFNTEMYKNCRLSVFFHPTDFDDQYSGESVEWVQVNGRRVKTSCRPLTSGCNKTAAQPLLPCVDSIPIDLLLDETAANGDLKIAAKIPEYVDECPYEANMLSAVPMVTCLVAPKHVAGFETAPMGETAPKPKTPPVVLSDKTSCVTKMPLQCATKGCASEIAIPVNSSCVALGKCLLSIEVQQTDYDNLDGTSELIEYIKVDGKEVKSKLNPGKNPCKTKWSGKPALTEAEMSFAALSDHVLDVSNGKIVVEGKISQFVDECASNGYLFDATAVVTCSKTGKATPALLEATTAHAATAATSATAAKAATAAFVQDTASGSQRRKLKLKAKGNAK